MVCAQTIDVLMLTTKVGGLGLNLTGADTVMPPSSEFHADYPRPVLTRVLMTAPATRFLSLRSYAALAELTVFQSLIPATCCLAGDFYGARLEPCG